MKKDILLFRISCACFFVMSFSVILSFFGNYKGSSLQIFLAVLTGVLFWGGLFFAAALAVLVNSHRKKSKWNHANKHQSSRIGIISFFTGKAAAIADIAMLALFAVTLATMFIPIASQKVTLTLLAFFLFAVCMHSMLNGVNYQYIKSLNEE